MGNPITSTGGGSRTCYLCGKTIWIPCLTDYLYKRKRGSNYIYFCRYNHMREYDRKREEKEVKRCWQCVHFRDQYGFVHCALHERRNVTGWKRACADFMKKDVIGNG